MDQPALSALVNYLATKTRTQRFLEKVENMLRALVTSDQTLLRQEFTDEEATLILEVNPDVQLSLKTIHQFLNTVPHLKVALAVRPSYISEKNLVDSLHKAIPDVFVVDVEERPTIIAGAIFEYQGRVADFSLKAKL